MNQRTFKGTIHVMPYTHADIAWVHTRAWHIERYTRVMDEVLELFETNPDYHYYVDTWVELIKPYIELRPNSVDKIRKYIGEGQLAVCAGQFGNVRSTNIGNETFIRNMQLGAKRWREFAPGIDLKVHSNIDVTFGHSQMPQLLSLMDIKAYYVMRPLAALDAQGIPRAFIWKGLSGDTILMYRDNGVGVFQEFERHGSTWDTNWEAAAEGLWNTYFATPAKDGTSNISLTVGVDDMRPERFAYNDTPAEYGEMIRIWNEHEESVMKYSTPNKLIEGILAEADKLKTVDGALEPTDVSFNIAVNGRAGIWWLREQADRLMVESEMIDSMAAMKNKSDYDECAYWNEWEKVLTWTPHAVQWLFRQDWREGALTLDRAALDAEKRISASCDKLVGGKLPLDSEGMALIGTHPGRKTQVIPLWIMNSDSSRSFEGIKDAQGRDVEYQIIEMPTTNSEFDILAEVQTPGAGYTTLKFEWGDTKIGTSVLEDIANIRNKLGLKPPVPVEDENYSMTNGIIDLEFCKGKLISVENKFTGQKRTSADGASFLEPVVYPIKRTAWSSDGLSDDPQPFEVESITLDEAGPLRWRITRTGKTGGFWVRQNIDLVKGEDFVRSTAQFQDPGDNSDCIIGMSIPISEDAVFNVDIPFGIEPRDVKNIKYGISERDIPGFFWGRTWANGIDKDGAVALAAVDGDKFFRAYGSPRRLVHFMAQRTQIFKSNWESYIDTFNAGGRQVFNHILMIGKECCQQDRLVELAESLRHPIRTAYIPAEEIGKEAEFINIAPSTVCLSAMYIDGGKQIIRLVQMSPNTADAAITLPFAIKNASAVNLNGKKLESDIRVNGNSFNLTIGGFKIVTLEVE